MAVFVPLLVVLATLYPSSLGTECFHARRALPIISHCQDLVDGIFYLSHMPGEDNLREWGWRLPTSVNTEHLPKIYWIVDRGPTTCAVHVDVSPVNHFSVDSFRQSDVGMAAARVVDNCLMRQRLLGLDYPHGSHHVYAMVVRTDAPFGLKLPGTYSVQNVSLPDSTRVLQIASGDATMSGGKFIVK